MSTETDELNKVPAPVQPLLAHEDSRAKAETPVDVHNDGNADVKDCKDSGCSSSSTGKVCAPCEGTAYNPKRAWFQESSTKLSTKSKHEGDNGNISHTKEANDSLNDTSAKADVDEPQDEDNSSEEDYDDGEEYHGEHEGELDEDEDEDEDEEDDDGDGDNEEVSEPPTKRKK